MERKGFIQLTLPYHCSSPKEIRTGNYASQEAGADAEAMEGMLLTGLLSLACLLSYRTQVYQPRDGSTHNGLGQGWLHPQWAGLSPIAS